MKFKIGDMVKILYREDERGNPVFPASVVGKVGHVIEVNKEAKKYCVHCYASAAGSRWINEDSLELANKDVQQVYGPIDVQVVMPPLQEQKIRDAIDKAMKHDPELVKEYKHYKYSYKGVKLDPYRILTVYNVTCPAMQHAIKKLLRAGNSIKDLEQDVQEVIDTLKRKLEMLKEDTSE